MRANSFHIEELDYGLTEVKNWNSFQSEPSVWTQSAFRHRDLLIDIYKGRNLANFHRRKASGELLPFTEYFCVKHECHTAGPSEVYSTRFKDGTTFYNKQRWHHGSSSKPLVPRNVRFDASKLQQVFNILEAQGVNPQIFVDAAASKIYSRGWDALTFFAEWKQVIRLFTGALYQFARIVDDYMRLFSSRPSPTTLLPTFDAWLQGRYGWRILIYDIQDINNLIRNVDKKQRTRYKDRTGGNYTHIANDSYTQAFSTYREDIYDVTEYEIGLRGSVITDFMPSKIQINPIVTAWELVPYSFVVDWFVSVGSALNALSLMILNDQYTAGIGYHCVANRSVSVSTEAVNGYTIVADNLDLFTCTESWELNYRKPVRISFTPHIRLNLDELKITDLIALLAQILYRLSRR